MAPAQPGIFTEGSTAHYALEFTVSADVETSVVRGTLKQARAGAGDTNIVTAFSGPAWKNLGGAVPDGLRPFDRLGSAPGPVAPATQRDILI